ncbi:MAG: hypothetical protein M1834_005234 [Cirrosporium novae-zelandiae]|nr:MAG: hypothetical protein M1834_005234 [Cirrosporium novae-zelandiae]
MSTQVTPEVLWAQRSSATDAAKNYVYLTISAPDVPPKDLKLDLTPTKLIFTGTSTSLKKTYHVELEFFEEIDPENSKTNHTSRDIEFVLRKKELKEEYWPRLLKEKKKLHFLRTDFDKWVDEDEQDAAPEDDYMNNLAGGADVPFGAGGAGGDGGFGGIDFSKLGAGAGMPGDMPGAGEGDDLSDDDMPELEDTEDAKESKPDEIKAEEVKSEEVKTEDAKADEAPKAASKIEELS